ncbi:MAG: hypothetical protein ACFBSE_13120 [Prochloraceae cyanobacterium]
MSYIEAENENTPADRLRELARNYYPAIREKVAANPNTPTDVLLDLGAEFPERLLDNPVFDLLLLENLNLAEEIPIKTLEALIKTKRKIPISFIERMAKRLKYRYLSEQKDLGKTIILHPHTPINILKLLYKSNHGWWFDRYIARNPNLKAENLDELARYSNYKVRYYVAKHPNTSGKTLDLLIQDAIAKLAEGNKKIKLKQLSLICKNVAENKNALAETLEKLASYKTEINDLEREIRQALAENNNTSLKVLEQLAKDEDDRLKMSVAVHPKFTVDLILKNIIDNTEIAKNIWIEKQTNTSVNILEKLARDPSMIVRLAVAKNPNSSPEAIEIISQKEANDLVAAAIAKNTNNPLKYIQN